MVMLPFTDKIDHLLSLSPYGQAPGAKDSSLLELFKDELGYECQRHSGYRNYVEHWPLPYEIAERVSDLPYLPVGILKSNPPLSFVSEQEVKRTLTSSATTSQAPSRVVLDAETSRRMTKGTVVILRDFIGSARRPYLVVDTSGQTAGRSELGARGAAIQGLQPFATETKYCLRSDDDGNLALDVELLVEFADKYRDTEVLIYGFTYILWTHLVQPLIAQNMCLNLHKVRILHSGGWKRLQDQAVHKDHFNRQLAQVVGCPSSSIVDFYGMVESVGVIFPDCDQGNKHAPVYSDVIVRDALTLKPVAEGELGIVQVCSVLPTSFPGNLLLTEDMARVVAYDGCACGRRGISFHFAGRVPKAEVRGCGNIDSKRVAAN